MNDLGGLLVAADRQAREILLDGPDPGRAKGLLLGWAEVMDTAADTPTAIPDDEASHHQDAGVLAQARRVSAAVHVDARRGWPDDQPPDSRVTRISGFLAEAGQRLRAPTSSPSPHAAEVSVCVLHTTWLLTHAVALSLARRAAVLQRADSTDPQARALMLLVERVRGVERLLDTRVNRRPPQYLGKSAPDADLASALTGWNTTMCAVLDRQPDPRHHMIVADVNLALVARTAALTTTLAQAGRLPGGDVQDRLRPALEDAARAWTRTRDQWIGLVTPDTSGSRPLMAAAIELRTILRDPALVSGPDTPGVLAAGLAAGVEAAVVSRAGLARIEEAPAVTVANLTDKMLEANPEQRPNRYAIWESMTNTEGRAPIAIPGPVREHLLAQADQTVAATIQARSASGFLLPTSAYAASVTFAAARTSTAPRYEPPPRTVTSPPSIGR